MYLHDADGYILDPGIREIFRQGKRYHIASLQDANPVVAARHNGYAIALISALRDLASDEHVKKVVGEDPVKMRHDIIAVQDKHEGMAFKILEKLKAKGIDPIKLMNHFGA